MTSAGSASIDGGGAVRRWRLVRLLDGGFGKADEYLRVFGPGEYRAGGGKRGADESGAADCEFAAG